MSTRWVVEVNECRVNACDAGRAWWSAFRFAHRETGRLRSTVVSLGGDVVEVACEDREHAESLAGHMRDFGLPGAAVKAKRVAA